MAELRKSPLDAVARPGRFGAQTAGAPGVRLAVRTSLSIVTIIARKGKAKALSAAMEKHYATPCPAPGGSATGRAVTLHWSGADQWFVVAQNRKEGALFAELVKRLAGLASVSDQSHGRVTLAISGINARDVLAKGTPVDLHPRAFGLGRCAVTQMAHIGVHIAQVGADEFEVSLFRGFAVSFWEWLTEMSCEFGYEVVV